MRAALQFACGSPMPPIMVSKSDFSQTSILSVFSVGEDVIQKIFLFVHSRQLLYAGMVWGGSMEGINLHDYAGPLCSGFAPGTGFVTMSRWGPV